MKRKPAARRPVYPDPTEVDYLLARLNDGTITTREMSRVITILRKAQIRCDKAEVDPA